MRNRLPQHHIVDERMGRAFEGQWQLAKTPGAWQDDLRVIYRRRD